MTKAILQRPFYFPVRFTIAIFFMGLGHQGQANNTKKPTNSQTTSKKTALPTNANLTKLTKSTKPTKTVVKQPSPNTIKPTTIKSTTIKSTTIKSTTIKSTTIKSTTIKPTNCKPNAEAYKVGILHYAFAEQSNLVAIGNGDKLHPDAAKALKLMRQAATKDKVNLQVGSAFRSIQYQQNLINHKKAQGLTAKQIYHWSAPAGYSEHHTGFAVDFAPIGQGFGKTSSYRWLKGNANKYGFYQSFNTKVASKSGVATEAWHWKYLNSPTAKKALANQACYQ
ncbi:MULTISPECIES: D-alanyl-D-alanine carboxypeptidase family protein [unclassified Moraxella]|uniref:M15 family metallopeptidase n=1 Tax=unclassified Moraxella TaxID=2685852 RepID=UPI003AF8BE31